jgi:hypothetical protein
LFFWGLTPRGLVGRYQSFGGTYYLHLQGVITQKINIEIFTAVRTSKYKDKKRKGRKEETHR